MERVNIILEYYHQNQVVFVIVALIIFVLLIFRFKSLLFRLFLIALVLFGTYFFIMYVSEVTTKHKKSLIKEYFPRERLK
jgi:hypothetical protein